MAYYPTVALVGRPNVGKSTLFNRLTGQNLAAVHEKAGTTRDRQYAEAEWTGVGFMLVDTGGIEALLPIEKGLEVPLSEDSAAFIREIRAQAEIAIEDADVIVLVVDIRTGITAADEEVADILRRTDKPVIVAANKGDNVAQRQMAVDFYELGLGPVIGVSGLQGMNIGDLLDEIVHSLPRQRPEDETEDDSLKIAILGRPNVGKSSLLNRLLGQERVIVSPVAGTTRDPIDTKLTYFGEAITLIDTAGIRRRGKIERGIERYSVIRALQSIKRADVCLLLIDAIEGITLQDAHVAGYITEAYKSVIVLVNKWDAIEKDSYTILEYEAQVRDTLKFLPYVPVLFISAKTGQRVSEVIPMAKRIVEERFHRLSTSELNQIVRKAVEAQAPPSKQGKRLKIRYASQVAVDPPKFLFHVNDPQIVHFSYERYLENQIREAYPFFGTPLLMEFRRSSEDRFKE
ncbi:MAG: ribosome biogenesis GTPase Der [Anaerolineae bacterium]|nr:ribosome biogenesis GTPase Der [Anaerolineae bacterium]